MELWERLKQRGAEAIGELCGQHEPEGQRLEFKQKKSPDRPGLSDDDRRGLGESLSAMSNAVGGIIVFGMIDEKGADERDCAKEPQLVPDVQLLAAKIEALITSYLSPPHSDVDVLAIELAAPGKGVIVIRVGPSEDRPHMSMAPGHQKYFVRNVAANLPMLDYQVRDLLRIRTTPQLAIGYFFERYLGHSGREYISVTLTLANISSVSAQHSYLIANLDRLTPTRISAVEGAFRKVESAERDVLLFQSEPNRPIHPGMTIPVVRVLLPFRRETPQAETELAIPNESRYERAIDCALALRLRAGCENSSAREFVLDLDGRELEIMADDIYLGRRRVDGRVLS